MKTLKSYVVSWKFHLNDGFYSGDKEVNGSSKEESKKLAIELVSKEFKVAPELIEINTVYENSFVTSTNY